MTYLGTGNGKEQKQDDVITQSIITVHYLSELLGTDQKAVWVIMINSGFNSEDMNHNVEGSVDDAGEIWKQK